jgi:hypothetical protein
MCVWYSFIRVFSDRRVGINSIYNIYIFFFFILFDKISNLFCWFLLRLFILPLFMRKLGKNNFFFFFFFVIISYYSKKKNIYIFIFYLFNKNDRYVCSLKRIIVIGLRFIQYKIIGHFQVTLFFKLIIFFFFLLNAKSESIF